MKPFFLLVCLMFLSLPAIAGTAGRVWQVAPSALPNVPASRQFRTISQAAKGVQPGDTVLIHSGVYRERVEVAASGTPTHPITFQAAPGADVTITGADLLTDWTQEPGPDPIFSIAWPYSFLSGPTHAHPDDDYHLLIGRVEQVLVSNDLLRQVLRRDQMRRGTFFVDEAAQRLYVWGAGNDDLKEVPVQASTRDILWHCTGAYVTLRGIRFRYAANAAQEGSAQFPGRGDVIQNCTFERTNGSGATFVAPDLRVQDCTFRDNGQLGFGAAGAHQLRMTGCLIENNNVKGFDRGWEAGGEKIVLSRGAVIDHCRVLDNRGVGLWFDIGNEGCEVKNCLIQGNEDAGIFCEISYGMHAHDNVIVGNGLADTPGAWGGAGGICLSSSPGCLIERNLLVSNKEGFDFREQGRTTPRIGAPEGAKEVWIWNHDTTVRHNVLAGNRDAQTWGWFDVWDERHWPLALQTDGGRERPASVSPTDFARDFEAEIKRGAPQGLSLEKLHLTFTDNLYSVPDGQGLFHWGTDWLTHRYYTDLNAVRRDLNMEQGSVVAPVAFGDYAALDFRVPAGSLARKMNCYPQGNVPGVQVGVLPSP